MLHQRHMAVIVGYVTVRVLRSILLTLTVTGIILAAITAESRQQLEQFPTWLESISNASQLVTVRAQGALNSELERQENETLQIQSRCNELIAMLEDAERQERLDVERYHAQEKDRRNLPGARRRLQMSNVRVCLAHALLAHCLRFGCAQVCSK